MSDTSKDIVLRAGQELSAEDLAKFTRKGRASASFGMFGGLGLGLGRTEAYEGASPSEPDLAGFEPYNYSPQQAISRDQPRLAARIHHMARNDGWASAAFTRQVDSVIGSGWRLTAKPNAIALGIDQEAADDLAVQIETEWRLYSEDPMLCDARQIFTIGMLLAQGFRHRVTDGEGLGVSLWLDRGGDYATALQVINPDRLSNPMNVLDRYDLRQGVELGPYGEPLAYHFRKVHPGDIGLVTPDLYKWERVARMLPNGRFQVIHAFEPPSSEMVRGVPPLAPVLQKLHMLGRYDKAELQASVLNAVLAAVVTSTDQTQVAKALEGADPLADDDAGISELQQDRVQYYQGRPLRIPGAQINYLYPTDKLELTKPQHPNMGF